MGSKHRAIVLFFLVALGLTRGTERTFAEDSIVVNTRQLAAGSPDTLLVRAFAGPREFIGPSSPVSVYLDRRLVGTAPYQSSSVAAGTWLIGVSAPGYDSQEIQVGVEDAIAYELIFHLVRATGRLSVRVEPADAELFVDGNAVAAGLLSLPSGMRHISAMRFGYDGRSVSIFVPEHGEASVDIQLKPAAFSLSHFETSRTSFNPANLGPLGTTLFSFVVSAPGSGRLNIVDDTGASVFVRNFADFSTWEQSLVWDGKDRGGQVLPDGTYTARLEATSAGGEKKELDADITIDSSLVARPFGENEGLAGLVFLPLPLPSPGGVGTFDVSARSSFGGGTALFSARAQLGLGSAGLGFDASGSFDGSGRVNVGVTLPISSLPFFGPGFGAGLSLGAGSDGAFLGRARLVLPLFSGFGGEHKAGTPVLFLGLAPGAEIGGALSGASPKMIGSVAGGILLTSDAWLVGLSAVGSSSDVLASNPGFGGIDGAVEARYLLLGGPMLLTFGAGGSLASNFSPAQPWIQAGIGLWF